MAGTSYTTRMFTSGEALVPYRAVIASSNTVILSDAVTERVLGITHESSSVDSGDDATIVVEGVYMCRCDGSGTAINIGDQLTPSATDGVLVKNAGTATHQPCAIALQATTEVAAILVQLTPGAQPNA